MPEHENQFKVEETYTDGVPTFGDVLRAFQKGYTKRTTGSLVQLKLTATSIRDELAKRGYQLTSGSYSQLSSGHTLPKDLIKFVGAIANSLDLNSGEMSLLMFSGTHDYIYHHAGDEVFISYNTGDGPYIIGKDTSEEVRQKLWGHVKTVANGGRLPDISDPRYHQHLLELKASHGI